MANLVNWGGLRTLQEQSCELTVGAAGVVQALPATARLVAIDVDNVDVYVRFGGATMVAGDVVTRATLIGHDERCRFDRDAKLFFYTDTFIALRTEAGNATVELTFYQEIF